MLHIVDARTEIGVSLDPGQENQGEETDHGVEIVVGSDAQKGSLTVNSNL
jgi:hypothetical protein